MVVWSQQHLFPVSRSKCAAWRIITVLSIQSYHPSTPWLGNYSCFHGDAQQWASKSAHRQSDGDGVREESEQLIQIYIQKHQTRTRTRPEQEQEQIEGKVSPWFSRNSLGWRKWFGILQNSIKLAHVWYTHTCECVCVTNKDRTFTKTF